MLAASEGIIELQRRSFYLATVLFSLMIFFATFPITSTTMSTQHVYGTLEGGGDKDQDASTEHEPLKSGFSFCGYCPYASSTLPQGDDIIHLNFTTTQGFGRTGNYVIAMRNALKLAYLCRAVLELPAFDRHGDAFSFSSQRYFDFRSLKGEGDALQAPECTSTQRNASYFFFLHFGEHRDRQSNDFRLLPAIDAHASTQTTRCLQQYLGICSEEEYCNGLEHVTDETTVVAHVRHGDIFPPNFSSHGVLPGYGQPPLSFYLSIFDFVKPKRVILIGEPSHEGPVWKAFRMLQEHNATRYTIEFRSGKFSDDLKLMLCAKAFVESRSTLKFLVRLGFASRIFTSEGCYLPAAYERPRTIYTCEASDDYKKYYEGHTNEALEWVDTLLEDSYVPQVC